MTGETKPRRKGTLVKFEKLPNNYSVTIKTSGATEKDTEVRDRVYSLSLEKEWMILEVDKTKLPISGTEFVADGKAFIQALWVPGVNAPTNGAPAASSFTPANEIKGTTTPPVQKEMSSPPSPAAPAKETEKPNTTRPTPSPSSQNDARRDPAWTNYSDKESWLRYIATINSANHILEGVWQPDPMKPQAENIANKIEWVISISAGLRARYEKNGGKA